eukprot:12350695-Alexandrium_andersonii.AAC.1
MAAGRPNSFNPRSQAWWATLDQQHGRHACSAQHCMAHASDLLICIFRTPPTTPNRFPSRQVELNFARDPVRPERLVGPSHAA